MKDRLTRYGKRYPCENMRVSAYVFRGLFRRLGFQRTMDWPPVSDKMPSMKVPRLAFYGVKLQHFWRNWPALTPLMAMAALVLLFLYASHSYHVVLETWLVQFHTPPFLDAGGITSAIECERKGLDTYLENPCDPLARPLVYPPIWKLGSLFPITYVGWTYGLAFAFIGLFLASLWFLPKPHSRGSALILRFAAISPPIGWALNGGNNELLLFALITLAVLLWSRGGRSGLAAYALIILAGALKYFPAMVMALAMRETPRRFVTVLIASVTIALTVWLVWRDEWPQAIANVWNISAFTYTYGTENISAVIGILGGFERDLTDKFKWLFSAVVLFAAWRYSKREVCAEALVLLAQKEVAFLLAGALLLVSSYLITQNVAYRLVYMLMVLPALLVIAGHSNALLLRALPTLSLFLMFVFPIRRHIAELGEVGSIWWVVATMLSVYAREVAWLFLASGLAALCICWLRQSQMFEEMQRSLPARFANRL